MEGRYVAMVLFPGITGVIPRYRITGVIPRYAQKADTCQWIDEGIIPRCGKHRRDLSFVFSLKITDVKHDGSKNNEYVIRTTFLTKFYEHLCFIYR